MKLCDDPYAFHWWISLAVALAGLAVGFVLGWLDF
jgi:hypothetical protein